MRSFFLLLRVQLLGLLNSLFPSRTNMTAAQRKRRIVFGCLGFALVALLIVFYVSVLSYALAASGMARVLPALALLLAALQGVVFTFFKANGMLFGFKDYDLVMSLPVPHAAVVASRMASLLCAAEVMALTTVPMVVVYFMFEPLTPFALIAFVLGIALAPLIPTMLASFAAFGITALAARFRHANIAYIVGAMLFFMVIIVGSTSLGFVTGSSSKAELAQSIIEIVPAIESAVAGMYPPAAWASHAVVAGSLVDLALYLVVSLAVCAACIALMQKFYPQINSTLAAHTSTGGGAQALKKHNHSVRSPFWAIVFKEWRTLIGIPTYAFNCLLGYLFVILVAVGVSFMGLENILASGSVNGVQLDSAAISGLIGPTMLAIPWVFAFCAILCDSSVVSVSLEGRCAWLMSTLPLSTRTVLGAKFTSNALPFAASLAIALAIMLASGSIDALTAVESLLVATGSFLLWVGLGMSLDIKNPNFTWMNAQDVVKRGAPITACIICGMLYSFACGALVVVGSMQLGVTAMHMVNLGVGIATCCLGAFLLARLTRRTPALYC